MSELYRLQNQIKHYEWGSPHLIPSFLGIENEKSEPCAEMWMGTHPSGPSRVVLNEYDDDTDDDLQIEFMQDEDLDNGGEVTLAEFAGGELPFLFKLLAVEKPLSIQAHPNKKQAEEGFAHENAEGLSLKAPKRNYKDTNHKPEIMCAITPCKIMAGFRKIKEIYASLEAIIKLIPQVKEIISPMLLALNTNSLAVFFRILYSLSQSQKEYLVSFILDTEVQDTDAISDEQWKYVQYFSTQYPQDPAILSPLYLNLFTLQPLQSVFIPAGMLHSYISGFGVELMANSDNVLRGGLTPKHVDIPELMNIVNFNPYMPPIFSTDDASPWVRYPAPCDEFSLNLIRSGSEKITFPGKGQAICLVTQGSLQSGDYTFKKGESFFIPAPDGEDTVEFAGNFSLFAAIIDK